MAKRIAFIRGINVGGTTTVPMADLRTGLEAAGFQNVRTYIQSGNVVYDPPPGAKNSPTALRAEADTITRAIGRIKQITPVVMVLDATAVAAHLAASPYSSADPAQAFLVFVDGQPAALGDLDKYATAGERWKAIDGVVHLHCPNGFGRSKLGAKLAGSTKVPTTTRNLRTIAKVLDLAGS